MKARMKEALAVLKRRVQVAKEAERIVDELTVPGTPAWKLDAARSHLEMQAALLRAAAQAVLDAEAEDDRRAVLAGEFLRMGA